MGALWKILPTFDRAFTGLYKPLGKGDTAYIWQQSHVNFGNHQTYEDGTLPGRATSIPSVAGQRLPGARSTTSLFHGKCCTRHLRHCHRKVHQPLQMGHIIARLPARI